MFPRIDGSDGRVRSRSRSATVIRAEEPLQLLYEETGKVWAEFVSWRHKVTLICATTFTTVLIIVAWMYQRRLGWPIAVPFAFAAIVAWMCQRVDKRNGEIIKACYEAAVDLERRFTQTPHSCPLGVYTRVVATRRHAGNKTYDNTLSTLYGLLAFSLAACAIATLLLAHFAPQALTPHVTR
jgi:hypothetical protein